MTRPSMLLTTYFYKVFKTGDYRNSQEVYGDSFKK